MTLIKPPGYKIAIIVVLALEAGIHLLFIIRDFTLGYSRELADVPAELLSYVVTCSFSYAMFCAISAAVQASVWVRPAVTVLGAVVAGLIFAPSVTFIYEWLASDLTTPWSDIVSFRYLIIGIIRFMISGVGLLALSYFLESQARERQLTRMQRLAQEAQLLALRYQINPHFLFNTLNSISALVLDRCNDDAERMIMRLSAFFRQTLTIDPASSITLAEEIELQRTYLTIEQTRFADRLEVEIDVSNSAAQALVPGLILQPLVENAIKHGMSGAGQRLRIDIEAVTAGSRLHLRVANSPADGGSPGTGTGLRNVRERLEASFGNQARIEHGADALGRFVVAMDLPFQLGQRYPVAKSRRATERCIAA